MSFSNYSELKTTIGAWRFDEGSVLSAYADDFIDLAEDRINNGDRDGPYPTPALRVREMETTATLTLTDGSATLPTGFLEVLRVATDAAAPCDLTYATPDWYRQNVPTAATSEAFTFYTIIGSTLRATSASTLELVYYTAIPALSDDNTTNWLLTKSPRVYVYGTGLEASIFRGDLERAQEMAALFRGALSGLQEADTQTRAGRFERRASGVAW